MSPPRHRSIEEDDERIFMQISRHLRGSRDLDAIHLWDLTRVEALYRVYGNMINLENASTQGILSFPLQI